MGPHDGEWGKSRYNFIADLNQERAFNASYKRNLLNLKKLVLIRFLDDSMVVPSETQWFGFYEKGQSIDIEPIQTNSRLYVRKINNNNNNNNDDDEVEDDPLGLRQMDVEGRLDFIAIPG